MPITETTTKNYVDAKVGEEVKRLRRAAGLSQTDLLKELKPHGIAWSRPLISWVETGKRSLTIRELEAIAGFFQLTPGELLTESLRVEASKL